MRTIRNPSPIPTIPTAGEQEENRRPGRVKCDFLYCRHGNKKFGQVTDLSRNGMRLVRKGVFQIPKGAKIELVLCWEQVRVPIWTSVAWDVKVSMFTHLMGLEFFNVTPDLAAVVQSLATKARTCLIIGNVDQPDPPAPPTRPSKPSFVSGDKENERTNDGQDDSTLVVDDRHEGRRQEHLPVDRVTCRHGRFTFGRLVDVSASGMRVFRKGRLRLKKGDCTTVRIRWTDTDISVKARVAWVRKLGFFKALVGFEFIEAEPATVAAVEQLGRVAKASLWMASAQVENGRNRVPFLRFVGRKGFPFNSNRLPGHSRSHQPKVRVR